MFAPGPGVGVPGLYVCETAKPRCRAPAAPAQPTKWSWSGIDAALTGVSCPLSLLGSAGHSSLSARAPGSREGLLRSSGGDVCCHAPQGAQGHSCCHLSNRPLSMPTSCILQGL